MKDFTWFSLVILIAAGGCKKYSQDYISTDTMSQEKKWVVTTVAGDGTRDFADGPALSARLAFPADIAVLSDGTMFVTDILNARIRKIEANQVSTFAGNGRLDILNGFGTSAEFINPYSITSDALGNLYTSDENDPRIRKITADSFVSVYAGRPGSGYVDGDADTASFGLGDYLAADPEGNVYVSDARNNIIRKISINGRVTTFAGTGELGFGDGIGRQAQFYFPGGIALDKQGNLFVADRGNYRIRKITPEGIVSTFSGTGAPGSIDGNSGTAQFSIDMHDIAIDSRGNVYVADESRIRRISSDGAVLTIAGSEPGYAEGDGEVARFNYANGLAVDGQDNIYVADLNNNRIRKISLQ